MIEERMTMQSTRLIRLGLATLVICATSLPAHASLETNLVFACQPDNDLYTLLQTAGTLCQRYATPLEAVQNAPAGAAVAILADGYPSAGTEVPAAVWETAATKNLRLYVEYPTALPGGSGDPVAMPAIEQINGNIEDSLAPQGSATRADHDELGTGLNLGKAAVFDGTGARFLASNLSGQLVNGAFALELWFQSDGAHQSDPPNEYLAEFTVNNPSVIHGFDGHELEFLYAYPGERTDNVNISDNDWHHVVIVVYGDGAVGVADKVAMYVDGQIETGMTHGINRCTINLSSGLAVGGIVAGSSNSFDGMMDEFAIYDLGTLPDEAAVNAKAAELAAHYSLGYTSQDYTQDIIDSGASMYWNFNEAQDPCSPLFPLPAPIKIGWERGVVASNFFSPELAPMRITEIFGCHYMPVSTANPHLVVSRVAGFDTATFGLTETQYPILYELPGEEPVMVATTKLSNFITGRYAPTEVWPVIWRDILEWLCPSETIPNLTYTPDVRPRYTQTDTLPADIDSQALGRAAQWFFNSRFLRHPGWPPDMLDEAGGVREPPSPDWPIGDGTLGMLECYNSTVRHDGTQMAHYTLRSDNHGEITGAAAINASVNSEPNSATQAENMLDFIYFNSVMQQGLRGDPASQSYGLLGWALAIPGGDAQYYGDDNARCMLGSLAASTVLNDSRWDASIMRCILSNFRTTGPLGFRAASIQDATLQALGWEYFWNTEVVHYAPHYQGYLWSVLLWAYNQTGYEPFLEKTRNAIGMLMAAYPSGWTCTNQSMTISLSRALLPLAWLVRADDTPQHRAWLNTIATDLLALQDDSGAIRETFAPGVVYGVPSNAAYGTAETSLLQENTDTVSDLLYACNFAFLGLHEAAAATGDPLYIQGEDKLAEFLCRIQIESDTHPQLSGAWYRGFDFEKWEAWGSNADAGWGVWCTESGWTVSWIASTLGLRHMDTSLWQLLQGSTIDENLLNEWLLVMMPGIDPNPPGQAVEVVNGNSADGLVPQGNVIRTSHDELGTGLKLGLAAVFDGIGARFVGSNLSGQYINGPYAIELWLQSDTAHQSDPPDQYLSTFASNNPGVIYGFDGQEFELFYAYSGERTDNLGITDNEWHHIAVIVYGDGTVGVADKIAVYLDGQMAAGMTHGINRCTIDLSNALSVGGIVVSGSNSFDGMIDEFAVYDLGNLPDESSVDAKAAELAAHYSMGYTSQDYTQAILNGGPTMYWNFNEGVGCTPTDVNCDGEVDLEDLGIMLEHWLERSKP